MGKSSAIRCDEIGGGLTLDQTAKTCGPNVLVENRSDFDGPEHAWDRWWQSFLRGAPWAPGVEGRPLRIVDLFCGAGGFGLGVSIAAAACGRRAFVERAVDTDPGALGVYGRSLNLGRAVNKGVSSLVDYQVRNRGEGWSFAYPPEIVDPSLAIEPGADLLIAGPPCQGHSNLNNRTRRRDPRNDLFICTIAIAVALRVKAVLVENVRTVTASHGDVVGMARDLLLSSGYEVEDDKFVRADNLGWPQTRERFFMTAMHGQGSVSSLPIIERRETRDVLWAMGDLRDLEGVEPFDTAPTPTEENRRRIDWLFDNDVYDLANSERPECHKNGTTYTAVYGRMHPDKPAPTITTGIGTPGQGRFIHPLERRLVTPHEAARIQGFPDSYGFVEEGVAATRKNLAKWIGDAVPPPMGYEMAARIFRALKVDGDPADR